MKLIINGQDVRGNSTDIAELFKRLAELDNYTDAVANPATVNMSDVNPNDFVEPIGAYDKVLSESARLRATLEADPLYNPFPGVVTPSVVEPSVSPVNDTNTNLSEKDTGVQR